MLIHVDNPIFKLKNRELKDFLEKYTGQKITDESTNRKNYVIKIYKETLRLIRQFIQNCPIWVSIDESTDADGRYIGNVIIDKLCSEPTKTYLLNCVQLEKCNNKTIAQLFSDSMNLLSPNSAKCENVFSFLIDASPYMVKAGSILTAFFSKLLHLTCLTHSFHRISQTIRCNYSEVHQLIATVKKIFLKAPNRVSKF